MYNYYMNDLAIRRNLKIKQLSDHFESDESLVIEELGLNHGKNRADIAMTCPENIYQILVEI